MVESQGKVSEKDIGNKNLSSSSNLTNDTCVNYG